MLLNWIDHPSYRRDEQLMHILFECGMATFEQLHVITGWSKSNLRMQIKRLQGRGKTESIRKGQVGGKSGEIDTNKPGEPPKHCNLWITSYRLPRPYQKSQVVYALGQASLHYVHEMRQEEHKKIKDPPFGQALHFIGTNQVLVRCLQTFGRDRVSWLSTQHITDLLLLSLQESTNQTGGDRRHLIRPDARLTVGSNHYYIEFDNDTEMPRQLERKFHRYVQILQATKDNTPILWITTNSKRQSYLRRNWEAIKRKYYAGQPVPDMYFFVQGDELGMLSAQL